ncbi:MAG: hypothetical protein GY940_27335, partial [bacterium]|nr:hypothetical protein [bacterium]
MLRVSLFFFILWIFSVVHLIALDPVRAISQYKLDIWQAERGLEQNSPTVILQDRDGYIWLGTLNGLVRFDGIRFRVFNRENTPRLKDNDIKALAQDSGGTLWIGTREGGLSYLKDGEFRTYSPDDHPELMEIAAIFPEPGTGSLWIGTLNSGLIRFNRGTFTTTTTHDGLPSDRVRAFHRDAAGNLLIATSKGLCIRDASGAITPYPGVDGDFKKYIMSMCKTRNGDLWLGCLDGLYRLRSGKITAYGAADGLPDIKIKCLTQDRDGNLWAGTESGGLVRIKNNHIETFGSKDGLASGFVYAIHEDREGNLWLGTLNGGLHRLRDIPVTPYGTAEGLNHDIVNNVSESPGGDVLVCTNNGLNRLSKGKVALDPTLERQLLSRRVTSVFESRKGYLWIGTDKGLNRYAGGRLEHFNNKKGGLYNYLVQLTEDQKGELLVMTTAAVSRFRDGSFTEIFNIDRVSNKFLTSLHCEPDGTLWIGTAGGGVCRLKGGRLNIYTTREGLVHNEVEWFHRDAGGALYIATRGGLSIREQRGFINYNSQSGLMDSDIRCILEDNAGYLWLGGRIGISRLPKEALKQLSDGTITRLKPLFFNESDGIESPWCNSGVKSKDGRLWFATDKGVIMIDPANIKESPLPPPVVIEEMTVDGEPINLYRLRARGTQASRLVLPPGKQRLQFNYTGLSFVKSHRIRFKHKLEGYDH